MMGDPRELFWEDEGLTEGLTDEEAQFLLGWLMDVAEDLDPAHPVSYTHLTLPTIYSV